VQHTPCEALTIAEQFPADFSDKIREFLKKGATPIVALDNGTYKAVSSQEDFDSYPKQVQERSRAIWGWGRVSLPGALAVAKKLSLN
jgi:hypothetical protein